MRWLVVLLLLANVFAFAWHYNKTLTEKTLAASKDTTLAPDTKSLTLVSELAEQPPLRKKSDREEFTDDAPDPEMSNSTEINTEAVASNTCVRTGPFREDEGFKTFRDWLRPMTQTMISEIETTRTRRFFWVYLESKSADDAKENLAELKRKGVKDYMLVRKGDLKNAISLGLFRSQDSVTRRLEEMSEQGYKPVVVPKFEKTDQYWLNASLAEGSDDVEAIETELTDGVEILEINCAKLATAGL